MIVLDASAAVDLALDGASAVKIAEDLAREGPTLMPGHFEADSYAGLRHMFNRGDVGRATVASAVARLAELPGERVPLAPLLPAAFQLLDRIGAHDSFYVVLALVRGASLLTSDGPLARAAEQLGARVLFRPPEATV